MASNSLSPRGGGDLMPSSATSNTSPSMGKTVSTLPTSMASAKSVSTLPTSDKSKLQVDFGLLDDDSEEELDPPALSKYAVKLLKSLDTDKTVTRVLDTPPSADSRDASPFQCSDFSSRSLSKRVTTSKRHPRIFAKLGLGAPRRMTDEIERPDHNGTATYSTHVFSNSRRSSYTTTKAANEDTESAESLRTKRPIINTPTHQKTGFSPLVKRITKTTVDGGPAMTPIRTSNSSDDLYDTPEQVRKALTPLSQSRMNRMPEFEIFKDSGDGMEIDLHRKDGSLPTDFKKVLDEALDKQRRELLESQRQHTREEKSKKDEEWKKLMEEVKRTTRNVLEVKDRRFEVIEQIGKGGSSKVYRAKRIGNTGKSRQNFAIKVVTFDEHDQSTINEFKGEVSILKKLVHEDRVIKLIDYVVNPTSMLFVMECGEIDLAHVLSARASKPFDLQFVRYHTTQILKCVRAVHLAGIVHADLKPANFLFVSGTLKLIDFGISNSVSDQTVNVYRECQMGTPNYMAPETLVETEQGAEDSSLWKIGKPADIWSCGCIIYQMCYGKPPYANYPGNKKILAITNPQLEITYPRVCSNGGPPINGLVIDTMKRCLKRDPTSRATAAELLSSPFLDPKVVTEKFMGDLVRSAVKYGSMHTNISEKKLDLLVESVWKRVNEYC
ncbi:DEKNAAC102918 [Brettanomyces naardenensis]|uniref:DEKNAAC102918 n=1 Tax=Brettanomyces naardenensis TaxID=13370 RepID=A0A448YM17_BRENA|nr:DEKNAAC102918 [Brettanomyces naardenensis]